MKRLLTATLALGMALTAACAASPLKNLEKAKALSGTTEKIAEARTLVNEALQDSATALNPYAHYIAGKVEMDAYVKNKKRFMVNPQAKVDRDETGRQLTNAFKHWQKALQLDTLGGRKPKYSKEIRKRLQEVTSEYFSMGTYFYKQRKYFPEEYDCFISYCQLPEAGVSVTDSLLPKAAYNAALAAYHSDKFMEAADAFSLTRKLGDRRPENYLYEVAALKAWAQKDTTMQESTSDRIADLSLEGYRNFGLAQPFYLRNYVNILLMDNRAAEAERTLQEILTEHPGNAFVLGLLGRIYDRLDNPDKAMQAYLEAAESPAADFEVLRSGARIIYDQTYDRWKRIEGQTETAVQQRQELRDNYLVPAQKMAERAKALNPDDHEVDILLENLNYVLFTGF